MPPPPSTEIIEGPKGRAELTWVGPTVLFVRVVGVLCDSLGNAFATRLGALALERENIQYFADMSGLTAYELMARSAFVRTVLQYRRRFASFVVLTWAAGVSPAANSIAGALGDGLSVLTDPTDFQLRLLRAAPQTPQYVFNKAPKPVRSRRPRPGSA